MTPAGRSYYGSRYRMKSDDAAHQTPFADFIGIRITHVSTDRVEADMAARAELGNRSGVLHGGALMALADNIGGAAAFANLPEGSRTTNSESKTNFFAAIPIGDIARAQCTPVHCGRTTMLWTTRIS